MLSSGPIAAPICIVGMHRSGTSCLAGSLEDCGLFLGQVNRTAPFNKKGNNENERLRDIHDAIFARVGATWDNPPTEPISWTLEERRAVRGIVAEYEVVPVWGFKDPRSLFLLDGWLDLMPALRFAGTFRHPIEVAASLAFRNGFDEPRSLDIWRRYNTALLAWRERFAFPIMFYDADSERYIAALKGVALELGLDANARINFREEGLTHHVAVSPPPSALLDLWDKLKHLEA